MGTMNGNAVWPLAQAKHFEGVSDVFRSSFSFISHMECKGTFCQSIYLQLMTQFISLHLSWAPTLVQATMISHLNSASAYSWAPRTIFHPSSIFLSS